MAVGHEKDYRECYSGAMKNRLVILKGIVYVLVMGVVSVVGIVEQGNSTYIVLAFLLGALLVFGVEVNTVKIGDSLLKIDFPGPNRNDDSDGED